MVREIISIGVGQCGIQSGYQIWRQYNAEHRINKTGKLDPWTKIGPSKRLNHSRINDKSFHCLYLQTDDDQFVPRNLFIDSEPNVIDDIKTSQYSKMYPNELLLSGNEDAGNNFARGYYGIGGEMIDTISDRLRKLVDNCDNVQGFILNHALGGGTGSGLGSLILERLTVDYRKKSKLGFHIYPSPTMSTNVVEPYNELLTTRCLIDHSEVSVVMNNDRMYQILQRNLGINRPSYDQINRLICKPISSMTTALRFEGALNVDLNELQTNLMPFPRLHFLINSYGPITTRRKIETQRVDIQGVVQRCFEQDNFLVKIPDWDVEADKYLAISMNCRGDVTAKEANATLQWLKTNKKVCFVEYGHAPGFKIGLNDVQSAVLEDNDIPVFRREASMVSNNISIWRAITDPVCRIFDRMYSQRAFIHWYINEGLEESDFDEAREDLAFLEKDYLDMTTEYATDESWTEDEEDQDENC